MSDRLLSANQSLALRSHPFRVALTSATDRFVVAALIAGGLLLLLLVGYLLASKPPYGPDGFAIGRDFVNTWMGAHIALTGDPTPWFDFKTYNAALQAMWRPAYPEHIWSYPPHLLLFTWPFGLMPYLVSYAIWVALGIGVYLKAGLPRSWDWRTLLLMLVSPAVVFNIFTGQNAFFTTALLIGGLTLLDRRPVLVGILFGILTIKPQLGILLPIMLVLTGRWRVIAVAVLTAIMLVAATALLWGPHVWTAYHDVAMVQQARTFLKGTGIFVSMMPTVFMNGRVAGIPLGPDWAAQAAVSALAVAAVIWAYWKPRDPLLSQALLITATFVATPYIFNYDMVIFGWLFAKLVRCDDNTGLDYALMFAVWTLPVTTILLGVSGIPGSALVLAAFAARVTWRLAEKDRSASPAAELSAANLSIS